MDKLTTEQRHKNMQAVKSTGTKIETALAKALFARGYRYRKNDKTVFGKPDLSFKNHKIAVFVDGEFWHGKDWEIHKSDHKSNQEFWHKKIEGNMRRDAEVNQKLAEQGWTVLRFWGRMIQKDLPNCISAIEQAINDAKGAGRKKIPAKRKEMKYPALSSLKTPASAVASKEVVYCVDVSSAPFPPPKNPKFTFVDLFAGIGGFRLALQNLGGKCVFTSEWDREAQKTYSANFGEVPHGDITLEETKKKIPDNFDVLCAGFPCQAFSIAGKKAGFEDTRGTLFFDIAEIIKRKQPKAVFLENVKGLKNHNGGKTLSTILNVLRDDLNYFVPEPQILNAKDFGLPQNRERIYIVAFNKKQNVVDFKFPKGRNTDKTFIDIREKKTVLTKYYLSNQYLNTLKKHKQRHAKKGNGFGFEIIPDNGIANAIMVGGMGRERNLVIDKRIKDFTPTTHITGKVNRKGIRRMTPREWAGLQGFPNSFIIPVADASAYKQFGNSVAVPAIRATAKELLKRLGIKC